MIPVPPPDPALGGMGAALVGAAVAHLFERSARLYCADPRTRIERCKPYYVKYKPAKYCLVQYELHLLVGGSGQRARMLTHLALYPAKRAEKLAARYRLDSVGSSNHHAAFATATYIPELHAIAQPYPVDIGLPCLMEAASSEKMSRRLRRALPGLGSLDLPDCEVDLIRYKAGKRVVLQYRFNGAPVGPVYGKLRRDGGRAMLQKTEGFRRAGIRTPETLTSFPDLGMMVQAEADGTPLRHLRQSPAYETWMPAVAEALAQLHKTSIDGLSPHSRAVEAQELEAAAQVVARLLPHLATEVNGLARRVVSRLRAIEGSVSTVHGSFHDDQVLVGEKGVTLVDLDSAGLGNPLSDVAHFLSYLSADGAETAYERFLGSYAAVRPDLSDDYLALEAASLLRWATLPFRELRPDWPQAVEFRVRRAADRLA